MGKVAAIATFAIACVASCRSDDHAARDPGPLVPSVYELSDEYHVLIGISLPLFSGFPRISADGAALRLLGVTVDVEPKGLADYARVGGGADRPRCNGEPTRVVARDHDRQDACTDADGGGSIERVVEITDGGIPAAVRCEVKDVAEISWQICASMMVLATRPRSLQATRREAVELVTGESNRLQLELEVPQCMDHRPGGPDMVRLSCHGSELEVLTGTSWHDSISECERLDDLAFADGKLVVSCQSDGRYGPWPVSIRAARSYLWVGDDLVACKLRTPQEVALDELESTCRSLRVHHDAR